MSKITRERAAQIAAGGGYNFDEVEELARIALHRSKRSQIIMWSLRVLVFGSRFVKQGQRQNSSFRNRSTQAIRYVRYILPRQRRCLWLMSRRLSCW